MSYVKCYGLEARQVLAEMYNNASPLGMGYLHAEGNDMTVEEAENLLSKTYYFDYVKGRPLKTSFDRFPLLDSVGYDRDQGGPGTLQKLVNKLQESASPDTQGASQNVEDDTQKSIAHTGAPLTAFPELKMHDKVWFVESFVTELKTMGIQYPGEWHLFMGAMTKDSSIFTGSMGGYCVVKNNAPVIKNIADEDFF